MLWEYHRSIVLPVAIPIPYFQKLDPATYYVKSSSIEFNIWIYLLLNVCTLVVSVLMLIGPSYLITRIHPARSIQFE